MMKNTLFFIGLAFAFILSNASTQSLSDGNFYLFLNLDCPHCQEYHQNWHSKVANNYTSQNLNLITLLIPTENNWAREQLYYSFPINERDWVLEALFSFAESKITLDDPSSVENAIHDYFNNQFPQRSWEKLNQQRNHQTGEDYPLIAPFIIQKFNVIDTPTLLWATQSETPLIFPTTEVADFHTFFITVKKIIQ